MSKLEEKSIKNQSKINKQKSINLGRHLGIDFSSIFFDFGSQNGTKLGRKIDKKSIKRRLGNLWRPGEVRGEDIGGFWRISGGSRGEPGARGNTAGAEFQAP